MEDTQFWMLAAKHLAGEASEQEVEALEAWMASDPVRRDLLAEAAQAWKRGGKRDAPHVDVSAAWNKLEGRIARDEAGSTPLSGRMPGDRLDRPAGRSRHPARRRVSRIAGGVAIMLAAVVAVLAVLFWSAPQREIMATKRGERITVELVDGTRVHLNAESRLTTSGLSGRGTRAVHLEGEALFEVAHDAHRPFLVHTHEGVIQVVGTAFNVDAYADQRRVNVAVEEGAVALLVKPSAEAAAEDTVVLRPRQLGVMADQRLLALHRDVDLAPYLAWTEGRLVFEDAPFPDVVRRLERWYDLDIDISSLDAVDRLNAVFDQESARDVIGDIALALGLAYEQDGARVRFYRRPPATTSPPPTP